MDYPFRTDRCSVVADLDMGKICIEHDWAYWKGGSRKDRLRADRVFYEAIKKRSRFRLLAPFRWFGVRIGGVGWLPFRKWRWGYGWRWPRTKAPVPDVSFWEESSQRDKYERLLRDAQPPKVRFEVVTENERALTEAGKRD